MTVTFLGTEYECSTAIKGADYVHLLDANGLLIASFEKVIDFSVFALSGGSWTSPTAEDECPLAVIGDDGSVRKSSHKYSDVTAIAQTAIQKPVSFSIEINRWTELAEPFIGCTHYAEVSDKNVTSTDFPDVYFDVNSIENAAESAIMVVSDVAKIIFYAESMPSVTLSGTYFVRKGVVE